MTDAERDHVRELQRRIDELHAAVGRAQVWITRLQMQLRVARLGEQEAPY